MSKRNDLFQNKIIITTTNLCEVQTKHKMNIFIIQKQKMKNTVK